MNALEFEYKLRKLNSKLYVGKTVNTTFNKELYSTGIYIRGWNDSEHLDLRDSGLNVEDSTQARIQNENPDKYLTWCTWKHVPEGNLYNKNKKLVARGWREIVRNLAEQGHIDLLKARKVFDRSDIGVSHYDRMGHDEKYKLQWMQP